MAGMTTANSSQLIRSQIWADQLKMRLEDTLMGTRFVDWLSPSAFPDGNKLTIPSIGAATVDTYAEDTPVQYNALDTGEWNLQNFTYLSSATYITEQNRQDSMYADRLEASFVPEMSRAIDEKLETDIFAKAQQAHVLNATINGASHRFNASGAGTTIKVDDFAKADFALKKANVPLVNKIAVVDPRTAYDLGVDTGNGNLLSFSNNPRWEGVVRDGALNDLRFAFNVYGWDIWISNFLPAGNAYGNGAGTNVSNMLFAGGGGDMLSVKGLVRQAPKVDTEYNKDFQREEYVVTLRYALGVYRPESMVMIDSVSAAP